MSIIPILIWTTTILIVILILYKSLYITLKIINIRLKELSNKVEVKNDFDDQLRLLINDGKRPEAIKMVKQNLRMSTLEAKHYIDLL